MRYVRYRIYGASCPLLFLQVRVGRLVGGAFGPGLEQTDAVQCSAVAVDLPRWKVKEGNLEQTDKSSNGQTTGQGRTGQDRTGLSATLGLQGKERAW